MDSLGLLLLVATGLVAFHVAIALYLYRVASTTNGSHRPTENGYPRPGDGRHATPDADAHGRANPPDGRLVRCGICGTPNDPTYRFCRQCIADLSGTGRTTNGPEATERLGS